MEIAKRSIVALLAVWLGACSTMKSEVTIDDATVGSFLMLGLPATPI